ncbi:MAG: alpha/beta fold hydrolase [Candidatus Sulfotelmatobacter sp.]
MPRPCLAICTRQGGDFDFKPKHRGPVKNEQKVRVFLEACSAQPHTPANVETMIAYNLLTPEQVRDHMLRRTTPCEEALREVKVPVLITHGEQDQIVIPAVSRHTASVIPHATISLYPHCTCPSGKTPSASIKN